MTVKKKTLTVLNNAKIAMPEKGFWQVQIKIISLCSNSLLIKLKI